MRGLGLSSSEIAFVLELLEHLETSPTDLVTGPTSGIETLLDGDGKIETIFLYALPRDGYSAYAGPLPRDRAAVRAEFGEPQLDQPGYDLYFQDEDQLHFEYEGESLALVTLSRQPLVLVFIPTLAALLTRAEELKGAPLTQDEVVAIRDEGVCMAMRQSVALEMDISRGYSDLDPEHVWEEWCEMRETT